MKSRLLSRQLGLLALLIGHSLVSGCGSPPQPETLYGWNLERKGPPKHPELIIELTENVALTWSQQGLFIDDHPGITRFLADSKQDPRLYPLFPKLAKAFKDSFGLRLSVDDTIKGDDFDRRLVRFFSIVTRNADDARMIGDSLSAMIDVASVYPRPRIGPAQSAGEDEKCLCPDAAWYQPGLLDLNQRHLDTVRAYGVDWEYAIANFAGADGSSGAHDAVDVEVVDYYIFQEHVQLDPVALEPPGFVNASTADAHGTLVMGLLAAKQRETPEGLTGHRGIAPAADYVFSPLVTLSSNPDCLEDGTIIRPTATLDGELSLDCALDTAYEDLRSGDVLHIPLADMTYANPYPSAGCAYGQDPSSCGNGYLMVPVNATPAYDLMLHAIASNGTAVVLAAGNAALDLTTTSYPPGAPDVGNSNNGYFDPDEHRFPWLAECPEDGETDCTSILVGAGIALDGFPYGKEVCSNFGARVDCQGWGDSVSSLSFSNYSCTGGDGTDRQQCWTGTFGMTSAASTLVAGMITVIQSMRQAADLPALTPSELRSLLRDSANGSSQGFLDAQICPVGPRPDLKNILASDWFPSDLYVRDELGDDDAVTPPPDQARLRAVEFESPDLVLLPIDLSIVGDAAKLEEGYVKQPSYVFETKEAEAALVRIRNRGGFPGRGRVHVYRTHATPIAPTDAWEHVGQADFRWVGPESLEHSLATNELDPSTTPFEDLSWVMVILPWDSEDTRLEIEALGEGIVDYQEKKDEIRFHNREQAFLYLPLNGPKEYVSETLYLRIHDFSSGNKEQAVEIRHDLPQHSFLKIWVNGIQIAVNLESGDFQQISGSPSPALWSGTVSLLGTNGIRISEFKLNATESMDWAIEVHVPSNDSPEESFVLQFDQLLVSPMLPEETRIGRMTYRLRKAGLGPS